MMAATNPEDCTTEGRYLSSLIIDEVLENIANSSSPSSSINPVELNVADSTTSQLVLGCGGDEVTDVEKKADETQGMPAVKRVTFSEDVTIVSYEAASQGESEKTDSLCMVMKDDEETETDKITKGDDDLGIFDGGDFTEEKSCCGGDGNLSKRKWSGSNLKDNFIIPNKMMRPEANSVVNSHNQQDANRESLGATWSHFPSDIGEEKMDAEKADVEAILEVSKSQDICVAVTQGEEEHGSFNREEGISVCSQSNRDSTVQDTSNPTVHSIYQNDTDTSNDVLHEELPSEDIIDDCRSILQSIVDNTLRQMVLNTKLDENPECTPDTDGQPPFKKMKSVPPSDPETIESFQIYDKMESYPKNIPKISNTSTADVEQLAVSGTVNVTSCSWEAVISHDNINLNLSSDTERKSSHKVPQAVSESSGVSTSNEDGMKNKDVDGDSPRIKEAVFSCDELNPNLSSVTENGKGHSYVQATADSTDSSTSTEDPMKDKDLVSFSKLSPDLLSGRECADGYIDLQITSDSTGVSTSTEDTIEEKDVDGVGPIIKEAGVSCVELSPDLSSGRENADGYRDSQAASDSTSVSTSTEDSMEDKDGDGDNQIIKAVSEISPNPESMVSFNNNPYIQDTSCLSTPDVEVVEDIQNLIPGEEPNAFSSILAKDLYLGDSVEYPAQSEVAQSEMHDNDEEYVGDTLVLSSADVELVKPDDAYVDVIEPSLREDIMPSPGSSGDDFSCTFQKASQVLANSQSDSHPLPKLDDNDLEITTEDLQVPTFDLVEPVGEEVMNNPIGGDWEASITYPDTDNCKSKALEVPVQDHLDIIQEPLHSHLPSKSEAKDTLPDIAEHHFLQILGLSPEQCRAKSPDQRKPCQSGHNEAFLAHVVDSSITVIEAIEENDPMHGNLRRPIEDFERNSSELSRIEAKGTNDQTVPSLQTSFKEDPCIDQLLDLEESIFSEQDVKSQGEPIKQSILVSEEEQLIEEGHPIPDHLQTLGQHAAGVFQWNHSPALTPCPTNADQSTLQCAGNRLDQTSPITPVRPLPACQRRRRVGLSRRQLVFPLHWKTFSRK